MAGGAMVWKNPKEYSDTLVGIDGSAIFAVGIKIGERDAAAEALESGADPAGTLGPKATVILFKDVQRIALLPGNVYVEVTYRRGAAEKTYRVCLPDKPSAAELMALLGVQLAGEFQLGSEPVTAFRAAFKPGAIAALILIFTWLLFMGAAESTRDGVTRVEGNYRGKKAVMAALVEALGPGGVLVVGTLLFAGAVLWLVLRLRKRPTMAVIKRIAKGGA